jgi:hypothetical protein
MVSDPTGPLNQCPRGHLIFTLSSGPSDDRAVYRLSTAAGSPHRTVPLRSMYAGQSRNITQVSIETPPFEAVTRPEHRAAPLIRPARGAARPGKAVTGGTPPESAK